MSLRCRHFRNYSARTRAPDIKTTICIKARQALAAHEFMKRNHRTQNYVVNLQEVKIWMEDELAGISVNEGKTYECKPTYFIDTILLGY